MKKISKFIINNKTKVLIISCIILVLSFIGMKLTTINYNILVYLPSEIDTIKGQDILTDEFNMGSYSIVVAENLSPKEILNLKYKDLVCVVGSVPEEAHTNFLKIEEI